VIYLPLLVMLPLVGGVVNLGARRSRRATALVDGAIIALLVVAAALVAGEAWAGDVVVHSIGDWPVGLGLGLAVDMLGSVTVLSVAIIGGLCLFFSFGELGDRHASGFHTPVFFLITGMNGIVLSTDLFNLFVFVELASISGYVLVAYLGGKEELEASLKYMILGTLSGLLFLAGIALIYDQAGSLNFGAIAAHLQGSPGNDALEFSVLMIMIGIGMPAAMIPVHTWLADAHSRAPSAVSALLSGASVQVAIIAMLRVFHQSMGLDSLSALRILPWAGLATAMLGALLALSQTDIKRLLAYTTVASGGFSVLVLSLGSEAGFRSLFLHVINHAGAKALLFLSAGCLIRAFSTREFARMGKAWELAPGFVLAFVIGAVADFGGPSLGFLSKTYMMVGLLEFSVVGLLVAALAVILIAASYLRVIQSLLSAGPAGETTEAVPLAMRVPVALLSVGVVVLGLLAWTLMGPSEAVAGQLMDRLAMIGAMLGI
jgi:multicomponent Na+:H+ antiporter subunit D